MLDDDIRAAMALPPHGPTRSAPTQATARERARKLLGEGIDGDPLEAWLIAHQSMPIAEQARALNMRSPRQIREWRDALRAAGKIARVRMPRGTGDYDTCPGCGGAKLRRSTQCATCAGRVRTQAAAATLRATGRARLAYYAPGGPPLSEESARMQALCAAACAAGDLEEAARYHRRYVLARARDWGLVAPVARARRAA